MYKYVYKVCCPSADEHDELIYIGSTIKSLSHRMANHRYKYRLFLKNPNYRHTSTINIIFNKYGLDNCKIIELEKFELDNNDINIRQKEQEYIDNNRHKTVNKQKAYVN